MAGRGGGKGNYASSVTDSNLSDYDLVHHLFSQGLVQAPDGAAGAVGGRSDLIHLLFLGGDGGGGEGGGGGGRAYAAEEATIQRKYSEGCAKSACSYKGSPHPNDIPVIRGAAPLPRGVSVASLVSLYSEEKE